MKKILLLTMGFLCLASYVYAAAYPMEVWPATQTKEMYSVTCSSSTATLILASDTSRIAYTISNPSDSYSIYLATFPITAAEIVTGGAWHRIKPNKDYYEETQTAYQAIYGLTEAAQTPIVVSGERRKK